MNTVPVPNAWRRRRAAPTRWLMRLVLVLGCQASLAAAADTPATAPPPSASQRLQQRFAAAVESWRKAVVKHPEVKPHDTLVRDFRVVVAPTPVPLLRLQPRLDGATLVLSTGWLMLLDELLRAEAASVLVADNAGCLRGYQNLVLAAVQDNRDRAIHPPRPLQAWPRLSSLIDAGDKPEGCQALLPSDLRSPALRSRTAADADATVLWLLTRQIALLAPLAAPVAASEQADLLAQRLLDRHGLRQPDALCWLRNNAADLFDEATVQALSHRPRSTIACWTGVLPHQHSAPK